MYRSVLLMQDTWIANETYVSLCKSAYTVVVNFGLLFKVLSLHVNKYLHHLEQKEIYAEYTPKPSLCVC